MKKYVFRKYKKDYPKLFEKEKRKLFKIIPYAKIEHIGSTSIPNLGGKGIIDILVGVKRREVKKAYNQLISSGYLQMPNASDKSRFSFKKDYGLFFKRRVHVHLTWVNSKTWKETIKFKENLIKSKTLFKKYSDLKKLAIKIANGDGETYRNLKKSFIKSHSK